MPASLGLWGGSGALSYKLSMGPLTISLELALGTVISPPWVSNGNEAPYCLTTIASGFTAISRNRGLKGHYNSELFAIPRLLISSPYIPGEEAAESSQKCWLHHWALLGKRAIERSQPWLLPRHWQSLSAKVLPCLSLFYGESNA